MAVRMTSEGANDGFRPTRNVLEAVPCRVFLGATAQTLSHTPPGARAGHVVAVRVTSEDANDGFRPTRNVPEAVPCRVFWVPRRKP